MTTFLDKIGLDSLLKSIPFEDKKKIANLFKCFDLKSIDFKTASRSKHSI